ncbi:MAG: sugar nucleotide-binding protein, partial [Candidatus Eremiobacteraeota bacterium]|nr:sugar nucleotide-binding protein [Candidatus Eremiobacteraeota bacterium]
VTCSPSYTRHVAAAIRAVIETERYGTYHVTNAGACTWYAFATEIFRQAEVSADLSATTQDAFPSLARRPLYSALAHAALHALNVPDIPDWRQGIRAYLDERRTLTRLPSLRNAATE